MFLKDGYTVIKSNSQIDVIKSHFKELLCQDLPYKSIDDRIGIVKTKSEKRVFYYINNIDEALQLSLDIKKELKKILEQSRDCVRYLLSEISKIEARDEYFKKLSDQTDLSLIRAIYYPVTENDITELTRKHQDKSLISIVPLARDENINFYKDDTEFKYTAKENELMVFGGLTLKRVMNNLFEPAIHSVYSDQDKDRIGLPFFFAPKDNFVLSNDKDGDIIYIDYFKHLKEDHGFY